MRRDLLLRHDRTVHAKDGGVPLHSDGKRRAGPKARNVGPSKTGLAIDTSGLSEQIEASSEGVFDVETAAMLVADLHHKATAAARDNGGSYEPSPTMPYTPNGAPLMDPAVTYPPGAVPVPQNAPWDTFIPHSVPEHKAHSVTSNMSGSFESQSFANVSNNIHVDLSPPQSLVRISTAMRIHCQSVVTSFTPPNYPT